MESDDEVEVMYAVEGIHNKRIGRDGKVEYFVKWKGFKQRTWEPIDNLLNVPEIIYEYEQANKQRRRQPETGVKKIAKEQRQTAPRKRKLTKLTHKENEASNIVDLDSSPQNRRQSYLANSMELECEENKQETFDSSRDQPRVKFTRDFPDNPVGLAGASSAGREKMSLYVDEVERVTGVERRSEKWMARVRFANAEERWEERDLVRILHPLRLLEFYEQLHKQRQRK